MDTLIVTTAEFELPVGYEDGDGKVHKTVLMRKVKNSDIIAIQDDMTIREISKENISLDTKNPVISMRLNAHMIMMFSLLFGRVVLRLGTIDKPSKRVFVEFYQEDMQVMMEKYADLNGVNLEETKGMVVGNTPLQ